MTDKELRFPVQFDEEWWTADLARTTPNGRKVAEAARLEYLPRPAGRLGMIFRPDLVDRKVVLRYLAFGVRHHPRDSHAETVYDVAHSRLHG